jgi:hypothetical protein
MDDFNLSTLTESRNEYCALLVNKLTPLVIQGIYSIFNEARKLCEENDEDEKYLMTFQNFLGRVPKWNQEIIDSETKRVQETSGCSYLEDLLTCVHVTQLKVLTSVRVGQKQKKIEIDIPKLNNFIHQIYIQVARRIYKNVFLFEKQTPPLQQQKNMRETELIVKECILDVIRNNMPIETILRSYLDETTEDDYEEIKEEIQEIEEPVIIQEPTISTDNIENQTGKDINNDTETQPKKLDMSDITNSGDEKNNIQSSESSNSIISPPQEEKSKIVIKKSEESVDETKSNTTMNNTMNNTMNKQEELKQSIQFNNVDNVVGYNNKDTTTVVSSTEVQSVEAPKDIERLEKISEEKWKERREEESDDEDEKLQILDDSTNVKLDLDFESLDSDMKLSGNSLVDDDDDIVILQ